MKYGASSSILILDYNLAMNKFQVVRRVEVPKVEYSFDKAVNMIIELNKYISLLLYMQTEEWASTS